MALGGWSVMYSSGTGRRSTVAVCSIGVGGELCSDGSVARARRCSRVRRRLGAGLWWGPSGSDTADEDGVHYLAGDSEFLMDGEVGTGFKFHAIPKAPKFLFSSYWIGKYRIFCKIYFGFEEPAGVWMLHW